MEIEFLEDEHVYLVNGVVKPSVSQLIRFKFPDQYKGVPEAVLKRKANYGTKTHDLIERFVRKEVTLEEIQKKDIDPNIKIAVEQFEKLRKEWAFHVKDMEQIVTYQGRICGKYDIRTLDDLIVDLKTTAEVHTEWLRWQLGLYYLCCGIEEDHGYCIWLPKGKAGKVIKIDVAKKEECIKLLDDYEQSNKSVTDFEEN